VSWARVALKTSTKYSEKSRQNHCLKSSVEADTYGKVIYVDKADITSSMAQIPIFLSSHTPLEEDTRYLFYFHNGNCEM